MKTLPAQRQPEPMGQGLINNPVAGFHLFMPCAYRRTMWILAEAAGLEETQTILKLILHHSTSSLASSQSWEVCFGLPDTVRYLWTEPPKGVQVLVQEENSARSHFNRGNKSSPHGNSSFLFSYLRWKALSSFAHVPTYFTILCNFLNDPALSVQNRKYHNLVHSRWCDNSAILSPVCSSGSCNLLL